MRASRLLGSLGLLVLFPASVGVAYLGYLAGLYGYRSLPIAVVGVLLAGLVVFFALLPRLRDWEDRWEERRRYEREANEE